MKLFFLLIHREVLLRWRHLSETVLPCFFFLLIACLFPLATTPDMATLTKIGVGIIWVSVLLALFMSLPQLFQQDAIDGSMDQLSLLPFPMSLIVCVKLLVQWVLLILPLLMTVPLVAVLYHLGWSEVIRLWVSLLLGTPILMLLGALLCGLTLGFRQQGLILALLLFPLYIPTLIFSSAMVSSSSASSMHAACALLGATLLISSCLLPLALAGVLRLSLD